MGARRIEKKPQKKPLRVQLNLRRPAWLTPRLVGGVLLVGLTGGLLGAGGWWVAQPTTLPIERVQVEGEFRYLAREDVYSALGDLASGGFFNVDVRAIKQATESLPWVDSASVRRVWPGTLTVAVVEQQPLARWSDNQVVNARGELFAPPLQGLPDSLPAFFGPEGTAQMVAERYQQLATQLSRIGLGLTELQLNSRRAWELRLNNGLVLKLGRTVNTAQLERFAVVYPTVLAEKVAQMESVDLRYTNGFAVRWKASAG